MINTGEPEHLPKPSQLIWIAVKSKTSPCEKKSVLYSSQSRLCFILQHTESLSSNSLFQPRLVIILFQLEMYS